MSRDKKDLPSSPQMEQHHTTVFQLSQRVASFYKDERPFRIYHGNTNSTRTSPRTNANSLDVSSLNHVISVDPPKKTCLCEPNVPMEDLLAATIKHGLMPPVVPEFRKITVGGAFSGTAGESSCFKHGFFDRCANWLEMILADGEIVIASGKQNSDLFRGAAGTFGTLGVTTLFELQLIDAKPYVELTYLEVKDIASAVKMIEKAMSLDLSDQSHQIDFLDGIMFGPNNGKVIVGRMISLEDQHQPTTTFHKPWNEWFYLHAQSQSHGATDIVPLESYIFRYDRGAFWMGMHAFKYFLMPFNRLTRFLLNPFMNTAIMYHALHRSKMTSNFVIQDMAVPADKLVEFSEWLDTPDSSSGANCKHVYPRWLCPLKEGEQGGMNPHSARSSPQSANAFINIGLWGPLPHSPFPFSFPFTTYATSRFREQVTLNRKIEGKLSALGGMKWLYAQTFYTRDEFWKIYDKIWYEDIRKKWRAETLMDVYDKVGPKGDVKDFLQDGRVPEVGETWKEWLAENVWPVRGLYGVMSAIKGGDYLRKGGDGGKEKTE
jgi:Delta24-sterol reductase